MCIKKDKYDDIINLPHYEPRKYARMPQKNRAAQFAPFAALTGHDMAIKEVARITERKRELDEGMEFLIGNKIKSIKENIYLRPVVTIRYFVPDLVKEGGAYIDITEVVRKIDEYKKLLILENGTRIPFVDILEINLAK